MPTGYTDKIYNGIEFEDFVLSCSRGFGALIHMRDHGMNAEITLPETGGYHVKGLNKARVELNKVTKISLEEAAVEAEKEYDSVVAYRMKRDLSQMEKRIQLLDMLVKVDAWTPPTSDHTGLKEFMVKQINETIRGDCETWAEDPVVLKEPQEWLDSRLAQYHRDIDYHMEHLEEDRVRNEKRQAWIINLFESLGRGDQVKTLKKVKF